MNYYRGRRKMGMFDHAKYSQPILRTLPDSVLKAVKKDMASLLVDNAMPAAPNMFLLKRRHGEANNDEEENNDDGVQQRESKLMRMIGEGGNNRKDKKARLSSFGLSSSPDPGTLPMINGPSSSTGVAGEKDDIFPEKPPWKKLAVKFMESHPTITLRPNEPTTMSDAAFSLVRRALEAAKERNTKNGSRNQEYSETMDDTKNLFRTLSDQTMFFQDEINQTNAYDGDGTQFDDDNRNFLEESPLPKNEDAALEFSTPINNNANLLQQIERSILPTFQYTGDDATFRTPENNNIDFLQQMGSRDHTIAITPTTPFGSPLGQLQLNTTPPVYDGDGPGGCSNYPDSMMPPPTPQLNSLFSQPQSAQPETMEPFNFF